MSVDTNDMMPVGEKMTSEEGPGKATRISNVEGDDGSSYESFTSEPKENATEVPTQIGVVDDRNMPDHSQSNASLPAALHDASSQSFETFGTVLNSPWEGVGAGEFMLSLYPSSDGHTAANYMAPDNIKMNTPYNFGLGLPFDTGLMPPGVRPFDLTAWNSSSLFPPLALGSVTTGAIAPINGLGNPTGSTVPFPNARPSPNGNLTPIITNPIQMEANITTDVSSFSSPSANLALIVTNPVQREATITAVVSSISSPNATLSITNPVQTEAAITAPNSVIQSRSGCTIIPSTRAEQSNKIGIDTKSLKIPDDKNCLPKNLARPDWMNAAHAHFVMRDLGEDWNETVITWERFEESLGYYCGKGLPGAKNRPVKWENWVKKSHRAYSKTSVISDPMDLGLATAKWWKSIQPEACRSSSTIMPLPLVDCPGSEDNNIWAPLHKGGPNGMIIIMTLLVWWGQRMKGTGEYQDDSCPLWKECVQDVRGCLEQMMSINPTRGRKRAIPTTDARKAKR
ncbi:hypothetical protein C0992_002948, partial [Termitomyces sp. T32_za158]